MLNRIMIGATAGPKAAGIRDERDRRFEALYMQSFIEMRARSTRQRSPVTR